MLGNEKPGIARRAKRNDKTAIKILGIQPESLSGSIGAEISPDGGTIGRARMVLAMSSN